jgi:hypothetical protein
MEGEELEDEDAGLLELGIVEHNSSRKDDVHRS